MPLLEVNSLSARSVLKDISFSIENGKTLGLFGESGSGKSTIARCVAGLTDPEGGSILFDGVNIYPETRNRSKVGRGIQMLFQNHTASLDPRMTIRASIMEGLNPVGATFRLRGDEAERMADLYGLPNEILNRLPDELSGGQRQRVALARAMSVTPKLLILDEPTSSLDAATQVTILKLVKDLQRKMGFAMLYISHDVATSSLMCDEMAVLENGVIVKKP